MVYRPIAVPFREGDIIHDTPVAWVHRDTIHGCYVVYCVSLTHSTSDSAYPLTPDGLSLAKARANYLQARAAGLAGDALRAATLGKSA